MRISRSEAQASEGVEFSYTNQSDSGPACTDTDGNLLRPVGSVIRRVRNCKQWRITDPPQRSKHAIFTDGGCARADTNENGCMMATFPMFSASMPPQLMKD